MSEHRSRWRILEKLGEGGMGVVEKALDERHETIVALKKVHGNADLRREAHTLSKLVHPNIAAFHEWFEEEDGSLRLVMEFVDGIRVDRWAASQPDPLRAAVHALRQLARALAFIHDEGYLHLDVKRSNVKVTREGHAKLLDFGVAVRMSPAEDGRRCARPRAGTPEYQSPEHSEGIYDADVTVDERADLYSLGILAYELLAGVKPFRGDPLALAALHRTVLPRPLRELNPSVPAALEAVVLRLLEKEPRDRFPSAAALDCQLAEIEGLLGSVAPTGRSASGIRAAEPGEHIQSEEEILRQLEALHGAQELQRLGGGSQGEVWKARNRAGEVVAVKIIRLGADGADPVAQAARVRREFAVHRELRHPHIVRVYELYTDVHGALIIEMEYVEGVAVDHAVRAHEDPARAAVTWIAQACAALEYAHDRGVTHRDLKPENVLVAQDGAAKVCDFGLAHAGGDLTRQTMSGQIMGTPEYLSPELITGQRAAPSMDIYALGIMLFGLLAGRVPFPVPPDLDPGTAVLTVIQQHLGDERPRLEDLVEGLPRALTDLAWRCIQRSPAQRPQTAGAVGSILADVLDRWHDAAPLQEPVCDDDVESDPVPLTGRLRQRALLVALLDRVGRHAGVEKVAVVGGHGSGRARLLRELHREAQMRMIPVVRHDGAMEAAPTAASSAAAVVMLDEAAVVGEDLLARVSPDSGLVVAVGVRAEPGVPAIELGPVNADEARMLWKKATGCTLPEDDVHRLHRHCGGMPGHVVRLALHLRACGLLDAWDQTVTLARGWDASVPAAVLEEIKGLLAPVDGASSLLGAAAAFGAPFDAPLLARLAPDASGSLAAVESAIGVGERVGLLSRSADGVWRFSSRLAAEALLQVFPHRGSLHTLCDVFVEAGAPPRVRATAWERAGRVREAMDAWREVARDPETCPLAQLEAWGAVLDLLRRDPRTDPEELVEALRGRAWCMRSALADPKAQALVRSEFKKAVDVARECVPLTRAATLSQAAQVLQHTEPDVSLAMLSEAEALLGEPRSAEERREKAWLHVRRGVILLRRGDYEAALAQFARAEPLVWRVEDWTVPPPDVFTYKSAVLGALGQRLAQRRALRDQQRLARRHGRIDAMLRAAQAVAAYYTAFVPRASYADKYYSLCIALLERLPGGDPIALATLHNNRAVHRVFTGRWEGAEEDYRQGAAISERVEQWRLAAEFRNNLAWLLSLQGRSGEARADLCAARRILRRLSEPPDKLRSLLLHQRGFLHLQRARGGRPSPLRWRRIARILRAAVELADRAGQKEARQRMLGDAALAVTLGGDGVPDDMLARAVDEARASDDARAEADALQTGGRCLLAAGPRPGATEYERAADLFQRALERLAGAEAPYVNARVQAGLGLLWLRDPARAGEARRHLEAARGVFQSLGAVPDAQEVQRALG